MRAGTPRCLHRRARGQRVPAVFAGALAEMILEPAVEMRLAVEAARIGQSLQQLIDELDRRKDALEKLNAELDQRVAARTREVERMADEDRHAAVIRERLRMARDLHDTLARSMMVLLT